MAIYKSILPSAYQQVEYIEGDGNSWINTDITPTQNYSMELKFQLTELLQDTGQIVAGTRENANSKCFLFGKGSTNNFYFRISDVQQTTVGSLIAGDLNQHIVSLSKDGGYIDGELYATFSSPSTFTGVAPITLLRSNAYSSAVRTDPVKARIYYCKIWGESSLVGNFIPCYRKADSVIGLYDTVNGVFCTNEGSGTFTKGNDITPKVNAIIKNSKYTKCILKGQVPYFNWLPKEYQEVEYIESDGTSAYLDTGLKPNDNFGFKIKVTLIDNTANAKFGVKQDANDTRCWWGVNTSNNTLRGYMGWGTNYPSATANRPIVSIDVEHTVETNYFNDRKYKFNGTDYFSNLPTLEATYTHSFLLFGVWDGGASSGSELNYRSQKISRATFTRGSSVIMDLIPCYRKSDNVYGMYDLIGRQFLTNANTSGSFTGGRQIHYYLPSEYQKVEYIKSTGTQYLDLGIKPKTNTKVIFKASINDISNGGTFLGSLKSSPSVGLLLSTSNAGTGKGFLNGTSSNAAITSDGTDYLFETNAIYDIEIVGNQITISKNGGTAQTFTVTDYPIVETNYNICLMARNNAGTVERYGSFTYYGLKIYEGTTLVCNMIPCFRKSDSEIGMFDLVSGSFLTNQGTGTFAKGRVIIGNDEYQEVEYIESLGATGTNPGPYIDIGFIPDNTSGFELETYFTQTSTDTTRLGVRQDSATNSRFTFGTVENKMYFGWGATTPIASSRPSVSADTWYDVKMNYLNDRKCQLDNVACVENLGTLSITFTYTAVIGGFNLAGAVRSRPIRIRKGIFTRGTTIERYLISVYRKSDSTIGLYDIINNKFYTNNGIDAFTKGNDIV